MPISDRTKRKLDLLIGVDSADDVVSLGAGAAAADSPILTGTITVGGAADAVGFFGAPPIPCPASSSDAPVGAFAVQVLSGMVGLPATTIPDVGATYNQMTLNDIVSSLATQINSVETDLTALKTLVNSLRTDLVTLGLIKGGP